MTDNWCWSDIHSPLLTNPCHIFMKYCCLAWEKHQEPTAQHLLGWLRSWGDGPRAGPVGLWEHPAQEPAPSFGLLMWVLGTANSHWTAAWPNYSAGFDCLGKSVLCWWMVSPCVQSLKLLPHCALPGTGTAWREDKLGCIFVAQAHGWHTPQTYREKQSLFMFWLSSHVSLCLPWLKHSFYSATVSLC